MAAPAQTTEGLPLLLSVTRTARLVGVSVRAVNGLIADGTLQAVQIPNDHRRRVVTASITRWLEAGAPEPREHRMRAPVIQHVPPFQGHREHRDAS